MGVVAGMWGGMAVGQTTYTVDPVNGNDALPNGPWASITGVNSHQSQFGQGDQILFTRGNTYRGELSFFDVDGSQGSPILIGATGTGTTPVICGSDPIADNTWASDPAPGVADRYSVPLTDAPKYVFAGGVLMTLARFPDVGWLRTDIGSSAAQIVSSDITQADGYWNGAGMVVRSANWNYDVPVVPAANGHTGTTLLAGTPIHFLDAQTHDWGFFMTNKEEELNAETEWFFKPGAGSKLLFRAPGSGSPTAVEVSQRAHGMYFNSCEFITVQDIAFKHHEVSCIYFQACADVVVTGCSFSQSTQAIGNYPPSYARHTYEQCTFSGIYNQAIISSAASTIIQDNSFTDIGLVPGLGNDGYGGYRGLLSAGENAVVQRNVFMNIGYSAMDVSGQGVNVTNNYINGALKILNDGGGIAVDDCDDMTIIGNVVEGMSANFPDNSESSASTYYAYADISFGIYFGFFSVKNTTVSGNTVSGCGAGMHSDHTHFSEGNRILRNTFFNNSVQLSISDASNSQTVDDCSCPPYVPSYDDEYTSNICYSIKEDQRCLQVLNAQAASWAGTDPLVDFGTFKDNYYFNPFSDLPVWINKRYDFRNRDIARTMLQWQSLGEDVNSHTSPIHTVEPNTFAATGSELVTNSTFTGNVSGWNTLDAADASCTAPTPDNGAMKFTGCYITQNLGGFTAFDAPADYGTYLFEFDARADAPGVLEAFVYREIGGFNDMPTGDFVRVGQEAGHYRLLVDIRSACGSCSDFRYAQFRDAENEAGVQTNTFYVDNVSLKKAPSGAYLPTTEHLLFTYNPLDPNSSQTYALDPGCWSDVYGNIYSGSVTIANAFESIVLFKLTDTYDYANGYTVSGNEVWSADKNVRGSLQVPSGASLTVDGATIGFADSRLDNNPVTNVVVQPGGMLKVINGGLLTSVPGGGCVKSMWDGVMNLGNGTSVGAGIVELSSGGSIANAYVAIMAANAADPLDPMQATTGFGGQIILDGAVLENNWCDIFTRYGGPAEATYHNSAFRTTRVLNGQYQRPNLHIFAGQAPKLTVSGCTFENSDPTATDPVFDLGRSIAAHMTRLDVLPGADPANRSKFINQFLPVQHLSLNGAQQLRIDNTDFVNCYRANHIVGTDLVDITYNTYTVRDAEINYGTYMHGGSIAHYKGNTFMGLGNSQPKVGALFESLGIENQTFYNNRFDGFSGFGPLGYSAGTIIQGNNDGPLQLDGFHFRCNDYSNEVQNDYDLALTGPDVTVGNEQGIGAGATFTTQPAGNTFNPSCPGGTSEQHIYVEEPTVQQFTYGHHDQSLSAAQVVPVCASPAIDQAAWYSEAQNIQYVKATACPPGAFGDGDPEDLWDEVVEAEAELSTLKEVYGNWTDGGNSTGLIHYIDDLANSSYQVRNQLMLVAPKVSSEAWKHAFKRQVPLNPWHMAQALIANSPLQPEVLSMMEEYGFEGVYAQLVKNAQTGGTSMLSIMEAEMAHWYGKQAQATSSYTAMALRSNDPTRLQLAVQLHTDHPVLTSAQSLYALYLTLNQLTNARVVLDNNLQDPQLGDYFAVQDLHLSLLENGQDLEDLDANGRSALRNLMADVGSGASVAKAWLLMLGYEAPDNIVLPRPVRSANVQEDISAIAMPWSIAAYPNPANGPVFFAVCLPEGAEKGMVRIIEPTGRLVSERAVPSTNIVEYGAGHREAGVYVAVLYADEVEVGHCSFVVVH